MSWEAQIYDDERAFFAHATAAETPSEDRGGHIFVNGRPVHVRIFPERDIAICATLIHYNESWEVPVCFDTVAHFNAHHLFCGGYCLVTDDETGCLYVNQRCKLSLIDETTFSTWIKEFTSKAFSYSRWYEGELTEAEARRAGNTSGLS